MSEVVIKVLEEAIAKRQKRIAKLEQQLDADHIGEYTKHLRELSKLFTDVIEGRQEHRDKITLHSKEAQEAWKKSRHQQDNLDKWMKEQTSLKLELSELSMELSSQKIRARCRS